MFPRASRCLVSQMGPNGLELEAALLRHVELDDFSVLDRKRHGAVTHPAQSLEHLGEHLAFRITGGATVTGDFANPP